MTEEGDFIALVQSLQVSDDVVHVPREEGSDH